MINEISLYIKSIAFFIIFMAFIEIVLPNGKYRSYINLVLGIILIIMMIQPVNKLLYKFNISIDNEILNANYELDKSIIEKESQYYNEKQKEIILNSFRDKIKEQITYLLEDYAVVSNIEIELISNENNIQIEKIFIDIKKFNISDKNKIKPIVIDENINNNNLNDNSDENNIKILKNIISDFYNLSIDNIYINNNT